MSRAVALAVVLAVAATPAVASAAVPAPPRGLEVAKRGTTFLRLRWDDRSTNETRFDVRYHRLGDPVWHTKTLGPNREAWTHLRLAPATDYVHRVRACNGGGCSAFTPRVRARTFATSLGSCSVFPPFGGAASAPSSDELDAFNQDVSQAPVDSNSDDYIDYIDAHGGDHLHPDFGSPIEYGIPYITVPASQPGIPIHFTAYGNESDPGPYPLPLGAPVEAGSDRHALVVDRGNCTLYELYSAVRVGSHWDAGSGAVFPLTQSAPLRHDGFTSADAAGLPIMPGLVRYDEVAAGHLDHAIRVTFDVTRDAYIHPATHCAGSTSNSDAPPMGLRLRMKAGYDIAGISGEAHGIAVAMKKYGLINADNGSNWFFTGASDTRWDDENLDQLKSIPGSAFEVVKSEDAPTVC
jgi:Fibronectin type III domain